MLRLSATKKLAFDITSNFAHRAIGLHTKGALVIFLRCKREKNIEFSVIE